MVITRTLMRSEPSVAGLHTFLGDLSCLLSDADWRELGRPDRIVVQVTVPREPDNP